MLLLIRRLWVPQGDMEPISNLRTAAQARSTDRDLSEIGSEHSSHCGRFAVHSSLAVRSKWGGNWKQDGSRIRDRFAARRRTFSQLGGAQ